MGASAIAPQADRPPATERVIDQALIVAHEAPYRSLADESRTTQLCDPEDLIAAAWDYLDDYARLLRADWGQGAAISIPDRLPDRRSAAAVARGAPRWAVG